MFVSCVAALSVFGTSCARSRTATDMEGRGLIPPPASARTPIPTCTGAAKTPAAEAPSDGRCELTPRRIVSASSFPRPQDAVSVTVSTVVASAPDLFFSLFAVDGSRAGQVLPAPLMRVALTGGEATIVASDAAFYGPALPLPEQVLFIARDASLENLGDAIIAVPRSGGAWTKLLSLPSAETPIDGLATDDTSLFFSARQGLQSVPLIPARPAALPQILVPDVIVDDLAVLGGRLIFGRPQGEIQSVDLPAGSSSAVTMLAMSGGSSSDLTVCGAQICWIDQNNNALEQLDPDSGDSTTLLTMTGALASADQLRFDGEDFYVLGNDFANTATLARVPRAGGCAIPVVTMPLIQAGGLAVDDACVYWANADGIFSIAKSAEGVRQ